MKRNYILILMLSLIIMGCGTNKETKSEQNQTDNTVAEIPKEEQETTEEKTENNQEDKKDISSKETSKNNTGSSTSSSNSNTSKKSNDSLSQTEKSKDTLSSNSTTAKPSVPKEEPKKQEEPEKKWAMSESEMIAYAKKCIVSYKPTSGYGKCEWAEEFNKSNSGWFEAVTIKIEMDIGTIKGRIVGATNSTLRKSTSQILDDGKGNIDKEAIYGAKGYFEKSSDNEYRFYVFY
ncbi:MAG: hypothetical protein RR630_08700 [Coprobacillus sp.]